MDRSEEDDSAPLLGRSEGGRRRVEVEHRKDFDEEKAEHHSSCTSHCSQLSRFAMALRRTRWWQELCAWRNYITVLVTPLLCAPVLSIGTPESRCAYVVLLMAIYWFSEAMPVGVTALLPVVLFPLLDVVKSKDISRLYMTDTNMMLFGSMLVAVSIEYWDIHKRIALRILMIVGTEPRWLMLGLMLATYILSMWISNMATAAMMIPITEAVLQQLDNCTEAANVKSATLRPDSPTHKNSPNDQNVYGSVVSKHSASDVETERDMAETPLHNLDSHNGSQTFVSVESAKGQAGNKYLEAQEAGDGEGTKGPSLRAPTRPANFAGLCKGMSLCICYAANIGGVATLTGTGPNMIMKGNTDRIFGAAKLRNPINFGSWMAFAVPLSLLLLVLCWLWLQLAFFGRGSFSRRGSKQDSTTSSRIRQVIREEYRKLGSLVMGQVVVIVMFILLVLLWITRDVGGVFGWGRHFKSVSNTLPGILIGILMFALPSTLPCLSSYTMDSRLHPGEASADATKTKIVVRPMMTWEYMNRKMPWQLVLLLGGGFAISEGFVRSGLSVWIGDQLYFFRSWNDWLVLLVFCFITATATELASNNAICSVLLPIMEELAPRIGANPLLFIIPVTLSTSFAFMLPVATPTNAIVFTYGRLKTMDMAVAGAILNLAAVPCTVFMTKTLGAAIFDLGHVPQEFLPNATSLVAP